MPETSEPAATGGCFCGQITYRVTGPIGPANQCHCSMCRKRFGGAGSVMSGVAPGAFAWTSGEEHLTRFGTEWGLGFCSTCGSTLVGFKGPDVMGISLACLDGDPPVAIARHLFVGSKPSWHVIGDEAPQFDEWPTG